MQGLERESFYLYPRGWLRCKNLDFSFHHGLAYNEWLAE